ncbi:MAG: hypothetical protein FWF69_05745 [Firmicutes bacterium]|nr:hypothetical protein [Bacillota bacterium]
MKKIMILLCIFILVLSALPPAFADARDLVVIQKEEPSSIWDATILANGEIWVSGISYTQDGYIDWLAKVNLDGTIACYIEEQYASESIFLLGDTRYVLHYVRDGNAFKKVELVPISEDGCAGEPIALKNSANGIIDRSMIGHIPQGILVYGSSLEDPWFTLYDENMNIVMAVDYPFGFLPNFREKGYFFHPSIQWHQDCIWLYGQFEPSKFYLMKADLNGTIDSCLTIPLPVNRNVMNMTIWDNQIFLLGKTLYGAFGAAYLTCIDFQGKVLWERVITDYHRGFTPFSITQIGRGFIVYGDRIVRTSHGDECTIFFAAVSRNGRVGKEVEISYFKPPSIPSGILFRDDFYVFGEAARGQPDHMVYEKFTIDDSWFPDGET